MLNVTPSYYKALHKKTSEGPVEPPIIVEGAAYLGTPITVDEQVELEVINAVTPSHLNEIQEYL